MPDKPSRFAILKAVIVGCKSKSIGTVYTEVAAKMGIDHIDVVEVYLAAKLKRLTGTP
jgi:hypothetical protein